MSHLRGRRRDHQCRGSCRGRTRDGKSTAAMRQVGEWVARGCRRAPADGLPRRADGLAVWRALRWSRRGNEEEDAKARAFSPARDRRTASGFFRKPGGIPGGSRLRRVSRGSRGRSTAVRPAHYSGALPEGQAAFPHRPFATNRKARETAGPSARCGNPGAARRKRLTRPAGAPRSTRTPAQPAARSAGRRHEHGGAARAR